MFSKSHTVKLLASIAVAASIAVVGARTAHAQTFITDTLGGNGHAQASVPFITDTLGGNGYAYNRHAYVPGGSAQQVAQAIQSAGKTPSPAPVPVLSGSSGSFEWGNAGIDAGMASGLLLLLAAGLAVRSTRRRVLAA